MLLQEAQKGSRLERNGFSQTLVRINHRYTGQTASESSIRLLGLKPLVAVVKREHNPESRSLADS
jgi:hypothetical protein